ncbi:PREDICTED: uncharacterized protein LOC104609798 [Nelumbo nucifera]|uniref:Uncharacterized protein LOC104609798 n=1 Tax=Nelumbo nucifera TaxID=4432 RepID=A0A1U8B1F9_NELNU|nr:PREDICTED: uncharacterized protein LOC104609798 [Nelumbo nucifera]
MVDGKEKKNEGEGGSRKVVSPYYLTANDNPGNIITQVQLKGDNYEEWARAMRMALRAKKKIGFIDGSISQPTDDSPELEDWWTIWEELANYEQIPTCICAGCNCNIAAKLEKRREEERVHQFLMGLDDAVYGTVRSNILGTDPLPNLNKVYAMVIQEERLRAMTRGKEEKREAMSFAVQMQVGTKRMGHDTKEKSGVCTNCGRTRHEAKSCFQLIGYSDWWGDRPRSTGGGKTRGWGTQCKTGRGRGGVQRTNAAQAVGQASEPIHATEGNRAAFSGLTNEQWSHFLNLLNSCKPNTNEKLTGMNWIIDTGASHHMIGNLNHLHDTETVTGCPVGLPDGKRVMAIKKGTVILNKHMKLTNVLYVSRLNCNLISVSQLLEESNCNIQITNKFCVVQDRTSRMAIGAGELREGLYYFKDACSSKFHKAKVKASYELWHKRIGHPSEKVIKFLPDLNIRGGSGNRICGVCLKAKQTRGTFDSSENNAKKIFDLIHCDLWGPYSVRASCGATYFLTIVDDFSRAVWIFLLNDKNEVGKTLRNFFTMVKHQYDKLVKIVRSDNGTEFICLKEYF